MKRVARRHPGAASAVLTAVGALALPVACGIDPAQLPAMTFVADDAAQWLDGAVRLPPPASGEARIYVTNNLDDTVSVVGLDALLAGATNAELARFPVGLFPIEREGPHHVSVDAAGRYAYVGISNYVPGSGSGPHGVHGAGTADGRVLQIDVDTLRTVAAERVDRNPGDVRLTPDGARVLLTHFDLVRVTEALGAGIESGRELDARLAIVDATTMQRQAMVSICPAAHGIAITSDSRYAVASCLSDEVAIVDLIDEAHPVRRVAVLDQPGTARAPICSPYAVTVSPDDATAWVSCIASGQLIAVDILQAVLDGRSIQLPGKAVFSSFAHDGKTLAVATQQADGIAFVDTARNAIDHLRLITPDVCISPHVPSFVRDDASVLLVCEGNHVDPGQILALEVASGAVQGRVDLGLFPDDLAVATRAP